MALHHISPPCTFVHRQMHTTRRSKDVSNKVYARRRFAGYAQKETTLPRTLEYLEIGKETEDAAISDKTNAESPAIFDLGLPWR